jgi:hypothetical protein
VSTASRTHTRVAYQGHSFDVAGIAIPHAVYSLIPAGLFVHATHAERPVELAYVPVEHLRHACISFCRPIRLLLAVPAAQGAHVTYLSPPLQRSLTP